MGKGIGRAILEAFLREGAYVYASDRTLGSLDDYLNTENVCVLYFDISDFAACKASMDTVNREKKRLDVLVNNAGIMQDALITTISKTLMEEIFAVNVFGTMEMLQLSAKLMMRSVGESRLEEYRSRTALGRLGSPEEIAEACVFLASDMSSYITGHILSVDAAVLV